MKNFTFVIITIFLSFDAFGQESELYFPSSITYFPEVGNLARVGTSFDAVLPTERKGDAFTDSLNISYKDTSVVLSQGFNWYVVRSTDAVKQLFSLDASIAVHHPIGKVDAKFSYDKFYSSNSNSITLVMEAYKEFAAEEIAYGGALLNDKANALINSNGVEFRKRFGTHYINKLNRGFKLYVFMTIKTSNNKSLESIEASLSASGKFGLTKVNMDGSMKTLFETASSNGSVSFESTGYGGPSNMQNFSSLLQSQNQFDYDKITKIVSEELSKYKYSTSVPIKLFVTPFSNLGLSIKLNNWNSEGEQSLIELNDLYWEVTSYKNYLNDILSGNAPISPFVKSVDARNSIISLRSKLSKLLNLVKANYDECKKSIKSGGNLTCEIPTIDIDIEAELPRVYAIQLGAVVSGKKRGQNLESQYTEIVNKSKFIKDNITKLRVLETKGNMFVITYFENHPEIVKSLTELKATQKIIQTEFAADPTLKNYDVKIIDFQDYAPRFKWEYVDDSNNPEASYIKNELIRTDFK